MLQEGPTLTSEGIFPTLRDPVAQERFERDGIVVVPVLEPEEALVLRRAVQAILPPDPGPFLDLFRNNPPELRKRIDRLIRDELETRAGEIFVDHDFWSATVLVKQPGEAGSIGLHTDWNMVDETRFRSGLIWLALEDTAAGNGGIFVVPGTNRLDLPYRGSDVHFGFDAPPVQAMIEERTVAVNVPVGHAAIWDNRLLHGSGPNNSDEWRIAAALGFKPRQAQLYHYRLMPDGVSHRFAIDREFFMDYEPFEAAETIAGPHVLTDEVQSATPWELTPQRLAALSDTPPIMGSRPEPTGPDGSMPRRSRWVRRLAPGRARN